MPKGHKHQSNHNVYRSYDEKREEYNVFNKPAHEILQSEWFTKTLPESWEGEDSDKQFLCIKHCEDDVL